MNRIEIIETPRGELQRFIVNGMEVSHAVWAQSLEQNRRLRIRRKHLRAGTFVRSWNSFDERNDYLKRLARESMQSPSLHFQSIGRISRKAPDTKLYPHACKVPFYHQV